MSDFRNNDNPNMDMAEYIEAKTLKELYTVRRNGHLRIFGTVLGLYSALWEWLLFKKSGSKLYLLLKPFIVHIPDGYALVLLSIPVIAWWIIYASIFIALGAVWLVFFMLLSILYIPISIYSVIFELPASAINMDWNKINEKYNKEIEDHFNKQFSYFPWELATFLLIPVLILFWIFLANIT